MKKAFLATALLFMASVWIGWNWKMIRIPVMSKEGMIECLNMETLDAYEAEASSPSFARMHPSPKKTGSEQLMGKMIKIKVADGMDANGYFIRSKKK